MRIYMQTSVFDHGFPRYYHLHLQQDLLEGWNLIREWGFQGAGGRVYRDHFTDRESAQDTMLRVRDEQLRHGYRVVFVQGLGNP